jgi:hypothetical protein
MNIRFSIEIESKPSSMTSVETKISDTLFPQHNYQLDSAEVLKESKAYLKNAQMITLTIIEYADGDYNWGTKHIKSSLRFIKRNYGGVEWGKRPMLNGKYPERENIWSVSLKEIHADIIEYCKKANQYHLDNIINKHENK